MLKNLTLLIFLAFGLLSQCTNNREYIEPKMAVNSVEQLASDTSFIALVVETKKTTDVLFNRLRYLGNDEARRNQSKKVYEILKKGNYDIENAEHLAIELGFNDIQSFEKSILSIVNRKKQLTKVYKNYKLLNHDFLYKAYNIVIDKHISSVENNKGGEVCVECPFNNCTECFGGGGGGCLFCVEEPGNNDGGATCKQACDNIRKSKRGLALIELAAELELACPGVAVQFGTWGTVVGPEGTIIIGGGAYALCGGLAYARYQQNITIAENEYIVCVSGCR